MNKSLYRIDLEQPGDLSPRAFSFWNDFIPANLVSSATVRKGDPDTGPWIFTWFVDVAPTIPNLRADVCVQAALSAAEDLIDAPNFRIDSVPDINWLEASYQSFPPFSVGRFFIYGAHAQDTKIPDGQIPLQIDAVTAFGSGEHPTTKGCLMLMDEMAASGAGPQRILDLGTGSGILAIAAWKLWDCPVMAVDIDRESVHVAATYRDRNEVPSGPLGMTCRQAGSPEVESVAKFGPYDLIIANILAAPLQELAPAIAGVAAPHATLILSGLLTRQRDEVVAAYTPHGYHLVDERVIGEWSALRLKR